jgi:hypothetical protein
MKHVLIHLAFLRWARSQCVLPTAYIDPGTGSMILQVILGGAAGLAVAVKMFWHRIVAFIPSRGRGSNDVSSIDS